MSVKRAIECDDSPGRQKERRTEMDEHVIQSWWAGDKHAGTIEKIKMKNFMCHSVMEVELNKNLNLIVGKSGSGKSAILSAVVVALGCKASVTNSGSSLKDFVKKGSRSSVVEVTLSNVGVRSYKKEVYGQKITVSRTIHSDCISCELRIYSENGKVISTKHDDLNLIMQHFNIQVDNSMLMVNEEYARTFIFASDPRSRYEFFMQATGLQDVDNLHSATNAAEEWCQKKLQNCLYNLEVSEMDVRKLQRICEYLQMLNNRRERMRHIENELFWAIAAKEEKALTLLEADISKEEEEMIRMRQLKEKFASELIEKTNEMRAMKDDMDSKSSNICAIREKIKVAQKKERTKRYEYTFKLREYQDMKAKVEQHEADLHAVKDELDKITQSPSYQGNPQRMARVQQLALLIDEQKRTASRLESKNHQYRMKHYNANGNTSFLSELQEKHSLIESSIERARTKLYHVKEHNDVLVLYGRWTPQLLRRIDEAHERKMFVRKPLGPIGSFVKVSDKRWTEAVEKEIGRHVLKSFFCHCQEDAEVLRQLMREVMKSDKFPNIIVSRFQDKVYNVHARMVQAEGYKTLFEMLEISDPNVANCLIDSTGMEGVLLTPTQDDAAKLMSDAECVPTFCERCITIAGDVYYPYPEYMSYANMSRKKTNLLQTSVEEAINDLEKQLVADQHDFHESEIRIKEWQEKIVAKEMEYKTIQNELQKLQEKKVEIDFQINDLKWSMDNESSSMQPLVQEKNELERELVELKDEECSLDVASKIAKKAMEDAKRDVEKLQETLVAEEAARQKIRSQLTNMNEVLKRLEMKEKEASFACVKLEKGMKDDVRKYNLQKSKTEIALKDARGLHAERIETDRCLHDIQKNLGECRSYLKSAEQLQSGSLVDVAKELMEKKEDHALHVKNLASIRKGLEKFSATLQSRKAEYCQIKRTMASKVIDMFQPLLEQCGHVGRMTFDHEERVLYVDILPAWEITTCETMALSAGERLFSAIAFIFSLWNCVGCPFYFLDELDVFMGKVNRRIIMDLLLYQAKKKNHSQYVFLAPQHTSIVNGEEEGVCFHQLEDPERSHV